MSHYILYYNFEAYLCGIFKKIYAKLKKEWIFLFLFTKRSFLCMGIYPSLFTLKKNKKTNFFPQNFYNKRKKHKIKKKKDKEERNIKERKMA